MPRAEATAPEAEEVAPRPKAFAPPPKPMVVEAPEERTATPPRAPTPPRAITLPREPTTPCEPTPPREPTPARVSTPPAQLEVEAGQTPPGVDESAGGALTSPPHHAVGDETKAGIGVEGAADAVGDGVQPSPRARSGARLSGLNSGAGPSTNRDLVLHGWDWSVGHREVAFRLMRESLEGLEAQLALEDIQLTQQREELEEGVGVLQRRRRGS